MNINALKNRRKWLVLIVIGIVLTAGSCKKEIEPPELPTPPTKWEIIAGTYKVYDTTGVYLYKMKISHKTGVANQWGDKDDSLVFQNFDNQFEFVTKQEKFSNQPDLLIKIGYHNTLHSNSQSNRWKILNRIDEVYNNVLSGDTLKMIFGKTNINYYMSDLTPYYACDCKQIAVKQH